MRRELRTEIHQRYQDCRYILGCTAGENIEDCWNVAGDGELSDAWTGSTRFTELSEKTPDGHTWSSGRLTRKQTTSRPDKLWSETWKHMSDASKLKEKQKWSRLCDIYFIDLEKRSSNIL